jgi:hydrogenase maturation protease
LPKISGSGNPILTDDGIGIHVGRALQKHPLPAQVTCAEASVRGLRLLSVIAGYERIILADAIQIPDGHPGDICRLHPQDLRTSLHSGSSHDLSLPGALRLGRELGKDIPKDSAIKIIAIQAEDVQTLGEKLPPGVKAAIARSVEAVWAVLEEEKEWGAK